jgi:hypothetical protein
MAYIPITLEEFDSLCKTEKGWVRNRSGYEYVYDYRIPNTNIMIKILSSINIEAGRNKGSDTIRVFAVVVDDNNKVLRGLVKSVIVYRVKGWKDRVIEAYIDVKDKAKEQIKRGR